MMNARSLENAIGRIEALMRLRGQQLSPVLMGDLQVLIDHAKEQLQTSGSGVCTCHERDSSYACDFCKSQGHLGHMEATA